MEIFIPEDIGKIKNRIFFNLTLSQLLCISAGILFALPVFFVSKNYLGTTSASALFVFSLLPFFFLAVYEKNNKSAFFILKKMMIWEFMRPKTRPYISKCIYKSVKRQKELDMEVIDICLKR